MKLGIIILNWNGLELLKKFVPSVIEFSKGHTIYIADNASTDESVNWLQETYPSIKILQIPENRGYAGGYNYVIPMVSEDVLCLLNSDIEVSAGWCDPMLHAFQNSPNLGAAQPKILDYNNKDTFEYAGAAGGFLDQLGYPYCRGRIFDYVEMDHGQYDQRIDIDWASGAALFISKSAFEDCKGFDADYFAHQEEIDLCWRLRQMDYSVQIIPESQVYHVGGGTLHSINPQKTFLNFRNSLITVVKNDARSYWWLIIFLRLLLDGLAAFKFMIGLKFKHVLAILKAHLNFYNDFLKILKKRNEVQKRSIKSAKNKGVKSVVATYYIMGRKRLHQQ
ncbi:glycosyltransferase family 2 protein [Nonlabens antarcticus]|uniref:glycosyltransferase family 2 protein n=1 Tax=Nonlabens antarcticus TaxID=392714 RepID=UPI0018918E51|nr:glycosyltransferase family 2 protein [Nonlabens antarcticus]